MRGWGPDAEVLAFLLNCLQSIRKKMLEHGIVDQRYLNANKELDDHVLDWENDLRSRKNTPAYAKNFVPKVTRIIDACGWKRLEDMNVPDINAHHKARRDEGISIGTCNHDIQSVKSFTNVWKIKA